MNYIWESFLIADKENINRNDITFVQAKVFSPYMELSLDELNITSLPENKKIGVNSYYRFYEIFQDLININLEESKELREVTLDILMHFLGKIDLKMGLCKEEFKKQFILKDILDKVYGEDLSKMINSFDKKELDIFLGGIITLYKTGECIYLFNKIVRRIFVNSSIYYDKEKPKDIYVFLNIKQNAILEDKIKAIIDTFLPMNMNLLVFWDKHFGVIGVDSTMQMDEIVMVM